MLIRRMGRPGLLGTVARTAVVAGTATMTANALNRRAMARNQQAAEAQAYEAQVAQQPAYEAPVAPSEGGDIVDKLAQLAQLHTSGALDDAEFEAAKQQLLR